MTIARAAVLHPSIWIFDDCLSSVDAGTEQAIVRNLRSITKDATAIFVTHRLLGFESVDRIIVLKEGRVTEQGTHAELLEARGWYARLYRKQRLDEDLVGPASLAEAG
jgi:ABC-type multidrug transport system fused ATPase/permease subunit